MNLQAPESTTARRRPADAASIRSQAVWALIAAIALLYFGYYRMVVDPNSFASQLLVYTLKYGGIAMVCSAVLLAVGTPLALMLDGVFSMVIGGALALAGAWWTFEVGSLAIDSILELIFGYLFFTAGLRNFREYCRLGEVQEDVATAAVSGTDAPMAKPRTQDPPSEAYDVSSREAKAETPAPEGFLASFAERREDDET